MQIDWQWKYRRRATLKYRLVTIYILISLVLASCSLGNEVVSEPLLDAEPLSEPESEENIPDFAMAELDDPRFGGIAAHQNGEILVSLVETSENDANELSGGLWISPEGESVLVLMGENGLPEKAIIGETIYLFHNFQNGKADISVIDQDGTTEVVRDIPIDFPPLSSGNENTGRKTSSPIFFHPFLTKGSKLEFTDDLHDAAKIIGAVMCPISLVVTLTSAGAGAPLAALACAGLLINTVNLQLDDPSLDVAAYLTSAGSCALGDCVVLTLEASASYIDAAEYLIRENEDEIRRVTEDLHFMGALADSLTGSWSGTFFVKQTGDCSIGDPSQGFRSWATFFYNYSLNVSRDGNFELYEKDSDSDRYPIQGTFNSDLSLTVSDKEYTLECAAVIEQTIENGVVVEEEIIEEAFPQQFHGTYSGEVSIQGDEVRIIISGSEQWCPSINCSFEVRISLVRN